jgi:hypothetical protein
MGWATFWAVFSQTQPVTLMPVLLFQELFSMASASE